MLVFQENIVLEREVVSTHFKFKWMLSTYSLKCNN